MPIKGITEVRRITRLGKIKTGIKEKNAKGYEYPKEMEHFVLNPVEEIRDKSNAIVGTRENPHIRALIDLYGEKPHEFKIVFPVDDDELICGHYLKWWSGSASKGKSILKCKGDGEFAFYQGKERVSGLDLPPTEYPPGKNRICNPLVCPQAMQQPDGKPPLCKPNMNLIFLIPEYTMFGAFQLDTTSAQAISKIVSCLAIARNALRLEGLNSVAGVPMRMFRKRTPNKHNNVNYIIHIEVDIQELKLQKQYLMERKKSTLGLGHKSYKIELDIPEEPDYDLLPKSEFPDQIQTGDPIMIAAPTPDYEEWCEDGEIITAFKKLSELKNTPCPKAKMLATMKRFTQKEDLTNYLAQMIEKEEIKQK